MLNNEEKELINNETDKPREYFDAAIYFAYTLHRIENIPMSDAVDKYSGLGREVTGMMKNNWEEVQSSDLWKTTKDKLDILDDPTQMTDLVFSKYKEQPHSLYDPDNSKGYEKFGSLAYEYQEDSQTIRIHFIPARSNESALSSKHILERESDFKKLLEDVHLKHPTAAFVKSSTWLQNLPNYRNLFPDRFQQRLKDIGASSFIGIWGQFQKGDGYGNVERLKEFKEKLDKADNFEEALEAFPFRVLETSGPISDFYKKYNIEK